jgi:hypothetical protein
LTLALFVAGCSEGLGPEDRIVQVDVSGTVTVDGIPIASVPSLQLGYLGCDAGASSCYWSWHVLDATETDSVGSYRLRGEVPEAACDRVAIELMGQLLGLLVWNPFLHYFSCRETTVDFEFVCGVDVPTNAPECAGAALPVGSEGTEPARNTGGSLGSTMPGLPNKNLELTLR